jgi:hypothetical protein
VVHFLSTPQNPPATGTTHGIFPVAGTHAVSSKTLPSHGDSP